MNLRRHVTVLSASWREFARTRRPKGPIDTDGKMLLAATADIYDQCADMLDRALAEPQLRFPKPPRR